MTNKEELEIYRNWFNFMYMCRNITMDIPAIHHALSYIDHLGRSWTVGNGEVDNHELHEQILEEMKAEPWQKSSWNSGIDTEFKKEYKRKLEEIKG